MSDMELIMQLARLEGEEQAEKNQQGEEGSNFEGCDSVFTVAVVAEVSDNRDAEVTPLKGSVSASASQPLAAGGDDELQALADLEKELGLDDLQLYLDSAGSAKSTTVKTPNFQSPEGSKLDLSMAVETGGSSKMNADDDDNLDELERYLESLSAPNPPN